jgi:hypothetical protein
VAGRNRRLLDRLEVDIIEKGQWTGTSGVNGLVPALVMRQVVW